TIPGDIPVESIRISPEMYLPPRQVMDRVGMHAGRDEVIGVADLEAHPAWQSRLLRRDRVTVETDVLQDKPGGRARTPWTPIIDWKIAIDPVPNPRPQHPKGDRLGDVERALRSDLYIADEVENVLGLGMHGCRAEEQQPECRRESGGRNHL